jgi:hypothetical protein
LKKLKHPNRKKQLESFVVDWSVVQNKSTLIAA